ncbi:MAG: hypothetical protein A2096_05415 [Spirochaetes bacterium GWF1_41_5]|nr:MAG: hypothetical protein A2096_05415 [Spirochaetes bacterium GWF1_41_5]
MLFINRGIGGDQTRQVQARFDWDVKTVSPKPTAAFMMLGMNDSGYGSVYSLSTPQSDLDAYRASCLEAYQAGMNDLISRLAEMNIRRITLFTPTPYEEHALYIEKKILFGKNGTLGQFAGCVIKLAKERKLELVDFYGAMNLIGSNAQQALSDQYTIISSDRVHPGEVGYLIMLLY